MYKQILTRAHERQYGETSNENKSIWQIAEDRENTKNQHADSGVYHENIQDAMMKVDKFVIFNVWFHISFNQKSCEEI